MNCQECGEHHRYLKKNQQLIDFFYCNTTQNPQLICRFCAKTRHEGVPCNEKSRKALVNYQQNTFRMRPCSGCGAFSLKEVSDNDIDDKVIQMRCSICKVDSCRICLVPWEKIDLHGPSFHRKGCFFFRAFPKIPNEKCGDCRKSQCKRPRELDE
mmetsp:Transcript_10745/g.10868  ORF Transcript_10745/g.10868 Transcript_10745/m.10868 type:complete len:155 (-) Transcript_10745:70-534(-)